MSQHILEELLAEVRELRSRVAELERQEAPKVGSGEVVFGGTNNTLKTDAALTYDQANQRLNVSDLAVSDRTDLYGDAKIYGNTELGTTAVYGDLTTYNGTSVSASGNVSAGGNLSVTGTTTSYGQLVQGKTDTNYSGGWSCNLRLDAADVHSISFHDAGNRLDSLIVSNGNWSIGSDVGWGRSPSIQLHSPTYYNYAQNKFTYNNYTGQWVRSGWFVPLTTAIFVWNAASPGVSSDYAWSWTMAQLGLPSNVKALACRIGAEWAAASNVAYLAVGNGNYGAIICRGVTANTYMDNEGTVPITNGSLYAGTWGTAPKPNSAYIIVLGYYI